MIEVYRGFSSEPWLREVVVQLVVRDHLAMVVAPVEHDVERERQEPMVPPRRSSSSGAQRDEELVQLPERLAQPLPEADALVGGLLGEDLTAADYVASYPLDLDHLSLRGSSD